MGKVIHEDPIGLMRDDPKEFVALCLKSNWKFVKYRLFVDDRSGDVLGAALFLKGTTPDDIYFRQDEKGVIYKLDWPETSEKIEKILGVNLETRVNIACGFDITVFGSDTEAEFNCRLEGPFHAEKLIGHSVANAAGLNHPYR